MKQILQDLSSGETLLAEVPAPGPQTGSLLIQSTASLVSIGTERMLIEFGRSGWIDKARKQPDKVKMVLEKIKTDGLLPTIEAVRAKLDQPLPLGYCNVGIVSQSAGSSDAFNAGDRVVSNGPHAEVVSVPRNLCAKVPDGVSDVEAAFTVVGSIGLQGIRLVQPTLGESVAVVGLGLIGLVVVQMLRANGCRVLGIDFDSTKCALARKFGAESCDLSKGEDPVRSGLIFTGERGMDAVIITASTRSNDPVHQAAQMSRKRGRIVLVGVVGLELSRADFYEKELTFQVSCSYGPGRYDENYELKGQDYPLGYVRWTEQRNFEAVLQMLAEKRIDVAPLISHRIPFENALQAYDSATLGKALGIVLEYPAAAKPASTGRQLFDRTLSISSTVPAQPAGAVSVGVIGAGNFTGQVLLPALKETGAVLDTISSAAGVSGTHLGRKFGFRLSTTDTASVLRDERINTLLITTRHSSHARYVVQGLELGKRVFVEKPLCVMPSELDEIVQIYRKQEQGGRAPFLMVGFNRRFAPHVQRMKALLEPVKDPKTFIVTVNAGAIPSTHWTQKASEGGRIIGEGCHFIDLLRFLAGRSITEVSAMGLGSSDAPDPLQDKLTITLRFQDGSIGSVHYFANGHKSYPKERFEVFAAGRVLQLDNFRVLHGFGWPGFSRMKLWRQDKGHKNEMAAFIRAARAGGPAPIPFPEIVEVTQAAFQAAGLSRPA